MRSRSALYPARPGSSHVPAVLLDALATVGLLVPTGFPILLGTVIGGMVMVVLRSPQRAGAVPRREPAALIG